MGRLNKLSSLPASQLRKRAPFFAGKVILEKVEARRSQTVRRMLRPKPQMQISERLPFLSSPLRNGQQGSRTSPAKSDAGSSKDSGYESSSHRSTTKSPPPSNRGDLLETQASATDSICVDCMWHNCAVSAFSSSAALLDHLLSVHVQVQTKTRGRSRALAVCKWSRCKAADRPASPDWLRSHVAEAHASLKPFSCPIHSCHERFATHEAALKHTQVPCFPAASSSDSKSSRDSSRSESPDRSRSSPFVDMHLVKSKPQVCSPFRSAARKHAFHDKLPKRVNADCHGIALHQPPTSQLTKALPRKSFESADQREQLRRCNVFKGGIEYNTLDGRALELVEDDVLLRLCIKRGAKLPTHLLPRVTCRRTSPDGQVELCCSFAHVNLPDDWIPQELCEAMGVQQPPLAEL